MDTVKYLLDENSVRYQLAALNKGPAYNWLFFPGGPGADSCYFLGLIEALQLPGNSWLVDLPGNGSNHVDEIDENFDRWFDCLLPTISKFSNPVYVGHSFGGMFPLLFPELEKMLKGFVIMNSTPTLWLEDAAKLGKEKNIPVLLEAMEEFGKNPTPETFKKALIACLPYYFPPHSLLKGKALLENVAFNYRAADWWIKKATEMQFNATWIPQHVPTLIIGGTEDCITPYRLFERDPRFSRRNILHKKIEGAGHCPWIENMDEVKDAFAALIKKLPLCSSKQNTVINEKC